MRVITWNRSFKGFNLDAADKANDDFDSEDNETHATVLDKMLAWEKKLYDEVKVYYYYYHYVICPLIHYLLNDHYTVA